jgi:3-oxoacyl-[acyl-carrier protein] reductase
MNNDNKRTIVVTGGSKGIGQAICIAFAAELGADIFFNFSSEDAAGQKTENAITAAGGTPKGMRVNVASEKEVSTFFKTIVEKTGRIDVLVNNAGITRDNLMLRMKERDWDAVMDINLKGAFHCIKAAARTMILQRFGRIINIASIAGVAGNAGQANYSASKAGLIGLTKSAAKELACRNITVNAIAPGFVETDMTAALPENVRSAAISQIPLGRAGTVEDVAQLAVFLASEAAGYITGQVIHVNGGMYI